MDAKILQLFKNFSEKSNAEISVQSCLHVYANILFEGVATSVYLPKNKTFLQDKLLERRYIDKNFTTYVYEPGQ